MEDNKSILTFEEAIELCETVALLNDVATAMFDRCDVPSGKAHKRLMDAVRNVVIVIENSKTFDEEP